LGHPAAAVVSAESDVKTGNSFVTTHADWVADGRCCCGVDRPATE
jgi:hypothetical protein